MSVNSSAKTATLRDIPTQKYVLGADKKLLSVSWASLIEP
jgi:hypothetical protein